MHSWSWIALLCFSLMGCVGSQHQLRQAVGPGPGPGCASSLDCACKNGSQSACEQLLVSPKAPRTPKPKEPSSPKPEPIPPPISGEGTAEPDEDTKDRCASYYTKCVNAGGQNLPGHAFGYSRCGSCHGYCTAHGYWPQAIYTWNGVRLPCPGL